MNTTNDTEIREKVRERYSQAALRVVSDAGCCGGSGGACCGTSASTADPISADPISADPISADPISADPISADPISADLYTESEAQAVPAEALAISLGCGNPTALAKLHPGETVLDLGSGGGIDVLLSAKRVGPTGFVYGLDMTDEMLAIAEENRRKAGAENVRFLKGYIENIPLPDNSVDVIISNCVINLAADKAPVLREAFRVLRPGGRFAVSDVIVQGEAPESILRSMEAWTGCIAGALPDKLYLQLLRETGFTDASIEVTRRYTEEDLVTETGCCAPADLAADDLRKADNLFVSAFIRATKPTALER